MTKIISRCIICGQFCSSKKELREHKDRNHRITNSKMMMPILVPEITTKPANARWHYQEDIGLITD
jgi:hypothetical protein